MTEGNAQQLMASGVDRAILDVIASTTAEKVEGLLVFGLANVANLVKLRDTADAQALVRLLDGDDGGGGSGGSVQDHAAAVLVRLCTANSTASCREHNIGLLAQARQEHGMGMWIDM